MRRRRLTRAELAAETGISKPTVGESVRRLTEAGLVVDTGRADHRRPGSRPGRLVLRPGRRTPASRSRSSIAPEGVVAECRRRLRRRGVACGAAISAAGPAGRGRLRLADPRPPTRGAAPAGPARLAVVSAADPVDRPPAGWSSCRTRRSCSASSIRSRYWRRTSTDRSPSTTTSTGRPGPSATRRRPPWTTSPTSSWARGSAARSSATARSRRGHAGLAGEIAHLVTVGPDGAPSRSSRCSASSACDDRVRPRSTSTGSAPRSAPGASALRRAGSSHQRRSRRRRRARRPELVVVGGTWGARPRAPRRPHRRAPTAPPPRSGPGAPRHRRPVPHRRPRPGPAPTQGTPSPTPHDRATCRPTSTRGSPCRWGRGAIASNRGRCGGA